VNKGYAPIHNLQQRAAPPTTVMPGSDVFTGTLDLLILKALTWGPRHGYAVGRWIRQTTEQVLVIQEGALYPALHRLERKEFVSEEWGESESGRQAKYYKLTAKGRAQLRRETTRWQMYSQAVGRALAVV
jgi:PadR family transcriptional regulator PadR